MLGLMEYLGAKVKYENGTVTVDAEKLKNKSLPHEMVSRMRASILFLAPMIGRFGQAQLDFPGGCVLGKRPTDAHEQVFENMGVKNLSDSKTLKFKGKATASDFVMNEPSVTATENAVMIAACTKGKTVIRLAAAEPHVQDLCEYLVKCGAKISGIGSTTIEITGNENLKAAKHAVRGDYLELGTWAVIAACTPKSEIEIQGGEIHDLDCFWQKMREMGVDFEFKGKNVIVRYSKKITGLRKLDTGVHPKFPTDLQAPFGVLLTQAKGHSKIFETLFDGRLAYLYELEKMGANHEMMNSHQAIVFGGCQLQGAEVSSLDIRAGAAMVVAGLAAKGETLVHDVKYFYRGYDDFVGKARKLGAEITQFDGCENK